MTRVAPSPGGHATDPAIIGWAHHYAQVLLEPLGRRWLHTQAAAHTAHQIAPTLAPDDAVTLIAATYLHDIGYAPALLRTGFHPLDGAHHLHGLGHTRLAGLVAHHTGARHEAAIRGLQHQLAAYLDEASIVTAALAYCDLTNGPDGQPMTLHQRRRDIEDRYGPDSPVVASLHAAWPELIELADTVRRLRPRTVLGGRGQA